MTTPDFAAAENFLQKAKEAYEAGDEKLYLASLQIVRISLGLKDETNPMWIKPR